MTKGIMTKGIMMISGAWLAAALTAAASTPDDNPYAISHYIVERKVVDPTELYDSTALSTREVSYGADDDTDDPDSERIYEAVEQPPQYPGGDAALLRYIGENLRYPQSAIENNVQGRVIVQFVVTKTGNIGEVKVKRSVDPELDAEAVRVVKTLRFQPGKQNGQAVSVWYALPFTFRLSGN